MIKYQFFGKENSIKKSCLDYQKINFFLKENGFNGQNKPVFVNQVHGNNVLTITSPSQIPDLEKLPDFDAIITNLKNLNICIVTADCVPIILFDETNQIIAVIHAGWRGAFLGIVENSLQEMLRLGANVKNIKAEIGPCIRQESYEIDEKFYQQFLSEDSANKEFFIPSKNENHYLFDLPEYVKNKLHDAAITDIVDEEIDTYKNESFESFRKKTHQRIKDDESRNVLVAQIN